MSQSIKSILFEYIWYFIQAQAKLPALYYLCFKMLDNRKCLIDTIFIPFSNFLYLLFMVLLFIDMLYDRCMYFVMGHILTLKLLNWS